MMIKIKFEKNTKAMSVKLTEDKQSYFTGKELVVGMGPRKELNQRKWILIARQVIAMARQHKLKEISVNAKDFDLESEHLAVNFEMANYEFNNYKSKKE